MNSVSLINLTALNLTDDIIHSTTDLNILNIMLDKVQERISILSSEEKIEKQIPSEENSEEKKLSEDQTKDQTMAEKIYLTMFEQAKIYLRMKHDFALLF